MPFGTIFSVGVFALGLAADTSHLSIEFSINKVHSLYNFAETISGHSNRSRKLREIFDRSGYNNEKLRARIREWGIISSNLDGGIEYDGFPKSRRMEMTFEQLAITASTAAKDVADFGVRTQGLLLVQEHRKWIQFLKDLEPIYDSLVWKDAWPKLRGILSQLQKASEKPKAEEIIERAIQFYRSEWPKDVSLKVVLYPVPGSKGHTNSESLGSIQSQGVLLDEQDLASNFGVMIHEFCHTFYETQSRETQNEIEQWFNKSESKFAAHAYHHINEGLATAWGNGYAYEQLEGKPDPTSWYNDRYVEGFARVLYPIVKQYNRLRKSFDKEFATLAIKKFEETFPQALVEFDNLFETVVLLTDGQDVTGREAGEVLRKHFRVRSLSSLAPINDPITFQELKSTQGTTVLMVLTQSHTKQLKEFIKNEEYLREYESELIDTTQNYVFQHLDDRNRATIVVRIQKSGDLSKAIETIKAWGKIDRERKLKTL